MNGSIIVINVDIRETRVALIEEGVIAELQIERAAQRGTVGNVVLGKVTRVLPGMQAAFIDVGQERSAFLHVEDLIRPDDFDHYLAGGASDSEQSFRGTGEKKVSRHPAIDSSRDENDSEEDEEPDDPEPDDPEPAEASEAEEDPPGGEAAALPESAEEEEPEELEGPELVAREAPVESSPAAGEDVVAASAGGEEEGAIDSASSEETSATSEAEPLAAAGAATSSVEGLAVRSRVAESGSVRGRRGRRRGKPNGSAEAKVDEVPAAENGKGRGGRRGAKANGAGRRSAARSGGRNARKAGGASRSESGTPARVSRSVPITEVVSEGDEVVVQISKEPIGTKGARVTSHVSLPGRYVVYLPTVDHLGISKRIGSARERSRLRKTMESLKPARGGLIVRTVAEGLTKKQLKVDVGYLIRVWAEVCRRRETAKPSEELYTELDLVLKVARDLFTDDVKAIVIDDREQHARLVRFVEMFLPERVKDIELYSGAEPIFDAYGIEDEIGRALSRKVLLPSGGSLIVDQAEALTAIDVNTGRYVGKGSKDLEETALKTNLEAVEEIAYQLRFRNIGGLVILDLIDMDRAGNRDKVLRALEQALAKDKAKTTLNRISELGLIEMTRKRTRESLGRMLHEPCFYCDGTGQIQSKATIAYEILRQIGRERHSLPGYSVVVQAHPAIVDFLKTEDRYALEEAARRYARRIELSERSEYHIEQYDLHGK